MTGVSEERNQGKWYEVRLQGHLDKRWSTRFDGMDLRHHGDGTTIARGPIPDQAALHGLLARIRDVGLPLLSVTSVEPDPPQPVIHQENSIGQ